MGKKNMNRELTKRDQNDFKHAKRCSTSFIIRYKLKLQWCHFLLIGMEYIQKLHNTIAAEAVGKSTLSCIAAGNAK